MLEAAWNAGEAFGENSLTLEDEYIGKFEDAGIEIKRLDEETRQGFVDKASSMYSDPSLGFSEGLFDRIQEIIK